MGGVGLKKVDMYLILIVGHTGQGKTTWVNNFIRGKKFYVFDVNNEYKNLPLDNTVNQQMRNVDMDVNRFLSVSNNLSSYNIVFEDATGFFRGKQSASLIRQVVAKRHKKNNFIILFHSINRVPPELMEMANFLILFKTVDNIDVVDKKFKNEKINKAFTELQKSRQYSFHEIKLI